MRKEIFICDRCKREFDEDTMCKHMSNMQHDLWRGRKQKFHYSIRTYKPFYGEQMNKVRIYDLCPDCQAEYDDMIRTWLESASESL